MPYGLVQVRGRVADGGHLPELGAEAWPGQGPQPALGFGRLGARQAHVGQLPNDDLRDEQKQIRPPPPQKKKKTHPPKRPRESNPDTSSNQKHHLSAKPKKKPTPNAQSSMPAAEMRNPEPMAQRMLGECRWPFRKTPQGSPPQMGKVLNTSSSVPRFCRTCLVRLPSQIPVTSTVASHFPLGSIGGPLGNYLLCSAAGTRKRYE